MRYYDPSGYSKTPEVYNTGCPGATTNGNVNDNENNATNIVNNPKEINIHGKINSEIDEIDLVNRIIFEDKNASKLYMANSDFPQTELQWAEKQIHQFTTF